MKINDKNIPHIFLMVGIGLAAIVIYFYDSIKINPVNIGNVIFNLCSVMLATLITYYTILKGSDLKFIKQLKNTKLFDRYIRNLKHSIVINSILIILLSVFLLGNSVYSVCDTQNICNQYVAILFSLIIIPFFSFCCGSVYRVLRSFFIVLE